MFKNFFKINFFNKACFEDILFSFNHDKDFILISTLPATQQIYLIHNTVPYHIEEKVINDSITNYSQQTIIIYGKNSSDITIETKYLQLRNLGHPEDKLFIFYGGLFEWSLLKDVYGDAFKTTSNGNDILHFKPTLQF